MARRRNSWLFLLFKTALASLLLLCVFFSYAQAEEGKNNCAHDHRVVESCYRVYGRLAVYANLRAYISIPQAKREVAVAFLSDMPEADYYLPEYVRRIMTLDNEIWGYYRICPFSLQKAGALQTGCVAEASHLRITASTSLRDNR